ncbi:MAG: hypothetical protein PVH47_01880 [Thiohalocapsa sp.]
MIRAYALEREYWDRPQDFGTRDKLYAHYRQGFSAEIAERMTEFTLDNDGDMATWTPSDVHVVRSDDRSALAWFRTPDDFIEGPWGFNPYMVVRLRRESDGDAPRWVVDWATDAAQPPAR